MVKRLYIDAIYLYYELDGCISGGLQHTNCDIFILVSTLIIDHEYCFDQMSTHYLGLRAEIRKSNI